MNLPVHALAAWTPFLLEGFAWNIAIAALAMLLGTLAGAGLAWLRVSSHPHLARASRALTGLSRNVPTIVFQFYLALMLPGEWLVPGTGWILGVPPWVKASLALAVAVVGFTSDNLASALVDWRRGNRSAALMFVPAWGTYLVIIVIASSTSSIIGVGELVSRSNAVINATGQTELMVPVYLYAMVIFFAFCWPLVAGLRRLRRALALRYGGRGGPRALR